MISRKESYDVFNRMKKYFVIEPELYNWEIYISDLTEEEKCFINDFEEVEEVEEEWQFCNINKCYFKYYTDVEWTKENNKCYLIQNYLEKQGYKNLTKYYG